MRQHATTCRRPLCATLVQRLTRAWQTTDTDKDPYSVQAYGTGYPLLAGRDGGQSKGQFSDLQCPGMGSFPVYVVQSYKVVHPCRRPPRPPLSGSAHRTVIWALDSGKSPSIPASLSLSHSEPLHRRRQSRHDALPHPACRISGTVQRSTCRHRPDKNGVLLLRRPSPVLRTAAEERARQGAAGVSAGGCVLG